MFQWGMTVRLDAMTKEQRRELRKKLKEELTTVQMLALKVEARELQLRQSQSAQVHLSDGETFGGMDSTPQVDKTSQDAGRPRLKILKLSLAPLVPPKDTETFASLETPHLSAVSQKLGRPRLQIMKQLSFQYNESSPTGSELMRNKRTPKANQLYSKADFVVGMEKLPLFSKSRIKHHKGKKGTLNGNGRDRKAHRSAFPTEIRLQCKSILTKLMSHRDGWIFNHPVNAEKLGLSDYHDIIKRPMDLGTIRTTLDRKQYSTALEFAEDVRLTFRNAMLYNPPANHVHLMASDLLSNFEKGWEVVDEKLKRIEAEKELELLASQAQEANGKKTGKSRTPKDPNGEPAKKKRKRVMTFEQKAELGRILDQLPQQVSEELISMMTEKNVDMCRKEHEIEIDPDTLPHDTLWELYRRAKSYLRGAGRNKKPAAPKAQRVSNEAAKNVGQDEKATQEDVDSDSSSSDSDSSSGSDSSSDSDSDSASSSTSEKSNREEAVPMDKAE